MHACLSSHPSMHAHELTLSAELARLRGAGFGALVLKDACGGDERPPKKARPNGDAARPVLPATAQLARRVLVFHRGAGVLQKTSFFLEEKLDFLCQLLRKGKLGPHRVSCHAQVPPPRAATLVCSPPRAPRSSTKSSPR